MCARSQCARIPLRMLLKSWAMAAASRPMASIFVARDKSSRNAPLPSWVACMVGSLRVLRLPAARRPPPACCDRGANAGQELLGGERLGEIAIHAYFPRPYTHRLVGVGRDQNGGNGTP